MKNIRASTAGFTLVELLTVVAVLSVLTSLLLPALSRGRQTARRAVCAGNLRQLGLAGLMYWQEHDGAAFRFRDLSVTNNLYWFGRLDRGAEGERSFDRTQGKLYPHLGSGGVEICPGLDIINPEFKLKATGAAYGYGYNLALSAPLPLPPFNVEGLRRPSGVAFLADAGQVNTFQAPASPSRPMFEEFYYINATEPTTHFRHSQRAQAAFCDGHVAAEKPEPGSIDSRIPHQVFGRLPPDRILP